MFANLFDKVPARRAGRLEDIAGTVLYLCSQAGVSLKRSVQETTNNTCRHTLTGAVCVWTVAG